MVVRRDEWVRQLAKRPAAGVRLFCFHYAGGAASVFRRWPKSLPDSVSPVAIQLPGREDRFGEPVFDRMEPLVDTLVELLDPHLDLPFAFFGCSMGARVAFGLSHALRDRGKPLPEALFVAASPGPSLPIRVPGWDESDELLIAYMRDLGGTPEGVLSDESLLSVILPTLRADLTTVATWPYQELEPLPVPIHALAGSGDHYATPDRMLAWSKETAAEFTHHVLPGDHFFIHGAADSVIDIVSGELASIADRGYALETGR
jgi:surfactin synthase thioesterase subunit